MRFRQIILAYFVIGAVMYGGGAIAWEDSGLASWFVSTDGGTVEVQGQTSENVEDPFSNLDAAGRSIAGVIATFGGPVLVVWNLIVGITGFLHWPVLVLATNNAPPSVTILLGGGFVVAFYMSLVGLVMSGS